MPRFRNYNKCQRFTRTMLCPGYFQLGKIKTMKQTHELTSHITKELVSKTEVWVCGAGGTGSKPEGSKSTLLQRGEPDEGTLLLTRCTLFFPSLHRQGASRALPRSGMCSTQLYNHLLAIRTAQNELHSLLCYFFKFYFSRS